MTAPRLKLAGEFSQRVFFMPRPFYILASIALSLVVVACGKSSDATQAQQAPSSPEGGDVEIIPAAAPLPAPTKQALEDARKRVALLTLDAMLKQEKAIEGAYKRGDSQALAAAADSLMQGAPDAGNWKTPAFDPYLKCDTAWRDLGLLASAMRHELDAATDTTRKITGQERADFQRTKKSCIDFLAMPALKAWETEEARFAK